ncbi:Transcriptional regulator, GntR family (plasmid) [Cupriavidus taiwanensis]|uniref:Transcriptional regulator, GntR family n=1 Tax=Cupriavidus taiwanensis TaxID=164546 RepID=A0A375HDE6_9BURK|nr:GntR family transcriptional regulator [Cupriavidus taiwanensis]SOZ71421.1 Transcriptional regulator, GntR family [Cupriavidus taiwanensis]SOZ72481.1 Transcriptional regulator, GntR family [Cupriavidus taiwanensis]SOZ74911.1 Transcriptional regulator, GntR family [Cupriavidus taiwanensis]SPA03345.1 Transcriptional regulator, GntR family [Cupriavidus taiwanensis]SPA11710.1 Transcriptional regulator, GntR family [Cupriavidus taiwanensis]
MTKHALTRNGLSLHEGLRAEISKRIAAGVYLRGEAIPSTSQLSDEFDVSPITVKRAVRDLQSAGMLMSVPGKGIFVKEQRRFIRALGDWMSSMDDARRLGFTPTLELLSISKEKITDPALALLKPPQRSLLCVRKVIFADGTPIMYDSAYISADVPDQMVEEFGERFIVDVLRAHNIELTNMSLIIDAAPVSQGAQQVFAIPNGYPMLRRLYHIEANEPGFDVFGVVESPFDRLACSVSFPAERINAKK